MLSSSHNIAIAILTSQQLEIVTKLGPLHSLVEKMGGQEALHWSQALPLCQDLHVVLVTGKEGHFLSIFSFYSDKTGRFIAWKNPAAARA